MKTGSKIAGLLSERGWKLSNLLAALDAAGGQMTRVTLSRIIHNHQVPTTENLRLLALALNTSADYLLGLTDDPEPGRLVSADFVVSVRASNADQRIALERLCIEARRLGIGNVVLLTALAGQLDTSSPPPTELTSLAHQLMILAGQLDAPDLVRLIESLEDTASHGELRSRKKDRTAGAPD